MPLKRKRVDPSVSNISSLVNKDDDEARRAFSHILHEASVPETVETGTLFMAETATNFSASMRGAP